jgi:hypothetical protein
MARPARKKPLWTCPQCGHRFVTRNMWHSCTRYRIADHFTGKDPALRALYRRYVALVRSFGPVTVYAQKTRIVFQARARFAGAVVRTRWLEGALWLKRRADNPRFHRIESILQRDYIHYFRLRSPEDLDEELAGLLREAYAVGRQEYS